MRAWKTEQCVKLSQLRAGSAKALIASYGMTLRTVTDNAPIPGSYWGESEAGLIGNEIFARRDTPVHSLLHEFAHAVCMDTQRRNNLHTDAGGTDIEECAVCYLQILLADALPKLGKERLMRDMDAWGYSFRLGGTRRWFLHDAQDARQWLMSHRLINAAQSPFKRLRS